MPNMDELAHRCPPEVRRLLGDWARNPANKERVQSTTLRVLAVLEPKKRPTTEAR